MSDDRHAREHELVGALKSAIEDTLGVVTTSNIPAALNALVIITGSLVGADHGLDIDEVADRMAETIRHNAREARAASRTRLS